MQKRFSLCAVSFPVIFAALIASAPVSGEENENASSPRQDITMDTGPSGIYHYYDRELGEWVSGVIAKPDLQENQRSQDVFPLIIAPEIRIPVPGNRLSPPRASGERSMSSQALLWRALPDKHAQCLLCRHFCRLRAGEWGICGVRGCKAAKDGHPEIFTLGRSPCCCPSRRSY